MKGLGSEEAKRYFKEFLQVIKVDQSAVLVYCDAHRSLIEICDSFNASRRRQPPGRPKANAVIERKVQYALNGLRACLTTAGLPNCFWPQVGHAFAVNDTLSK